MEKDTREKLDELVLVLQKKAADKEEIGEGYKMACTHAIQQINGIFGTNYERHYPTLQEHFKEKPCKEIKDK